MRLLLPIAALLVLSAPPARSCSDDVAAPRGMISDEARIAPLVEKIQEARRTWSDAIAARGREYDRRDRAWREKKYSVIDGFKAKLGQDFSQSSEFQEAMKEFSDEKRGEFMHNPPLTPDFPALEVDQTSFLCGSATLEDGHSINKGSYWSFRRMPEYGWSVSGVEMHYLLEHHQANPDLIGKLERFFSDTAPSAPGKASSLDGEALRRKTAAFVAPASWN